MDENALCSLQCLFDEAEDLIRYHITRIQYSLVVSVDPEISQIDDANRLPMVGHLPAATIDYAGNFICNNEFQVLGCELISNEQAILHFDGTQDFVAQSCP
jgi:hypothetical protein